MKLSRKILKFTEPLTYRRGWRRAQRSIFPVPLRPMLEHIDSERAREIQQRYANSTAGYAKYADIHPWLRLNRERVQDLNLHRSEPKRVLDLGCGGGFFLFILKNLGHSVVGLDIARVPLFGELLELFAVQRVVYKIDAFEPLPDLGVRGRGCVAQAGAPEFAVGCASGRGLVGGVFGDHWRKRGRTGCGHCGT